jgi:hypothetical protein
MHKRVTVPLLALLIAGCTGDAEMVPGGNNPGVSGDAGAPTGSDPWAPCTDYASCCTSQDIVCTGDPDNNPTCKCTTLWDCSQNPKKCDQDLQEPTGGGSWTCTWTEKAYVCTGPGSGGTPPGGAGWSCQQQNGSWVCTKQFPPNPSNKPGGTSVWSCKVDDASNTLVCERDEPTPPPSTPPPTPTPSFEGNCADGIDNDGDGKVDCKDEDCPSCPPPACPPGKECCDGKDNDGDGQIDEGNVCAGVGEPCPPGAFQSCDCYCGVHRKCKADGTWGPCIVDGNNTCAVAQITSHSQCPFGYCDYGKCDWGFMQGNQCKTHADCPTGQICDLGECLVDPYQPCP